MQATPDDYKDLKDSAGRAAFQERYGLLIYAYPMRLHHLQADKARDFYLYGSEASQPVSGECPRMAVAQ